ncbi:hypothetical protein AAHC03_020744 [Spirometra sp. Aus1]
MVEGRDCGIFFVTGGDLIRKLSSPLCGSNSCFMIRSLPFRLENCVSTICACAPAITDIDKATLDYYEDLTIME